MAAPVTLVSLDPSGKELPVGAPSSPLFTQMITSSAANTIRALTSTTVATLKSANAGRKGLTIFNESAAILYIKLGGAASASDYTYAAPASGYYEVPFSYTGIVTGILASGTGFGQVTEMT